jgi:hypothetical protein
LHLGNMVAPRMARMLVQNTIYNPICLNYQRMWQTGGKNG